MGNWAHPRWLGAMIVGVLAGSIVTGCTANGGDSNGGSTATSAPTTQLPTQPVDLQPRDDLKDEHVASWNRYEIVSDHSVRVHFWIGDPNCFGARATVGEDASTVRISVFVGTLPEAPQVCTAISMEASLLVTTGAPIGTRSIVPA